MIKEEVIIRRDKLIFRCPLLPRPRLTITKPNYLKEEKTLILSSNKHCEILVSCSDEERTVCKLRELHASLCNCMQAYVTACKLM